MVTIILPSFNRPCQLELLLRSLREYWSIDQLDIKILYKWSGTEFFDGYMKLIQEYNCTNIEFVPEIDGFFGDQVKNWIETSDEVVGFLTDDCVMFRKPLASPNDIKSIIQYGNIATFSLRLSPQTIVQDYLTGQLQPELQYGNLSKDVILWKWNRYNSSYNWSYIFSWDSCFYDKNWLYNLVKDKQFNSPRALEHQLSIDPALRDINKPYMAACTTSSVFVNTINRVQPNGPQAGTKYPYSPEMLNQKFLSGKRISLDGFAHLSIISSHEEFPLTWDMCDI